MSNRYRSTLSLGSSTPAFTNTKSIALDGVDDFVSTGLNLSYTTYPNVSFSCWIKMDKASLNTFTLYSPTGAYVQAFPNSSPIRILTNGTKQAFVSIQGSGGTTVQSTTDLSDGNWHNIVQTARYEATGTVNNVYVDSVKEITDKLFLSYSQITGDFFVGARNSTTQFFVGGIDEVAVFDSELSQSDITAIYGTGVPTSLATYNPLLWYRCGDGDTAPTLTDNGSGGNNGTMQNFSTFSSDVPVELFSRKSIALDGVDDYVDCGNDSSLNLTSQITWSAWVKFNALNNAVNYGIVSNFDPNQGFKYTFIYYPSTTSSSRKLRLRINSSSGSLSGYYDTSIDLSDDQWHHVAFSFDGTTNANGIKVYVDGVNVNSFTASNAGIFSSSGSTLIGAYQTASWFANANIDEVSLYNTELSASDITSIYNSGAPNDISSLSPVSWWRCGDGDTSPTLTDNGSGGNNGTMTNFTTFSTDVPT